MPWDVLAATAFCTVEVATWHGLVTYYVLVVMELATRRIHIAGITPHPPAAFMQQGARPLTDPCDGCLLGKRYLIHDRDTKDTQAFDALMKASGVEPVLSSKVSLLPSLCVAGPALEPIDHPYN